MAPVDTIEPPEAETEEPGQQGQETLAERAERLAKQRSSKETLSQRAARLAAARGAATPPAVAAPVAAPVVAAPATPITPAIAPPRAPTSDTGNINLQSAPPAQPFRAQEPPEMPRRIVAPNATANSATAPAGPFAAENAKAFVQTPQPVGAPLDRARGTPAPANPQAHTLTGVPKFASDVFGALASQFENPAAAIATNAAALPKAALTLARASAEQDAVNALSAAGKDPSLVERTVSPKDAAIAAAQLGAVLAAPEIHGLVSKMVEAAGLPYLIGHRAAGALAGTVAGAPAGAAFNPEHPGVGAAVGAMAGGAIASAMGDKIYSKHTLARDVELLKERILGKAEEKGIEPYDPKTVASWSEVSRNLRAMRDEPAPVNDPTEAQKRAKVDEASLVKAGAEAGYAEAQKRLEWANWVHDNAHLSPVQFLADEQRFLAKSKAVAPKTVTPTVQPPEPTAPPAEAPTAATPPAAKPVRSPPINGASRLIVAPEGAVRPTGPLPTDEGVAPATPAATPAAPKPASPAPAAGPREYIPESSGLHATEEQMLVRNVARGLKTGHPDAIAHAAPDMAPRIPTGAVLVPLPDHTGNTVANTKLASAIADLTGAEVLPDLVTRSTQTPSSRELRQKGKPGLTADEHEASMVVNPSLGTLPANRPVVFIDNVETTGATAEGARRVLGRPDAQLVTYAKAPIPAGEEAATAKPEETKETLSARAQRLATERGQTSTAPASNEVEKTEAAPPTATDTPEQIRGGIDFHRKLITENESILREGKYPLNGNTVTPKDRKKLEQQIETSRTRIGELETQLGQAAAPEAEKKPKARIVGAPKSKWKELGKNAEGDPVFQDDRGVRSVVRNGVRSTEPVGIRPNRVGGASTGVDRDADGLPTRSDFITSDEAAKKTAKTRAPDIKPDVKALLHAESESLESTGEMAAPGPTEQDIADREMISIPASLEARRLAEERRSRTWEWRGPNSVGHETGLTEAEAREMARRKGGAVNDSRYPEERAAGRGLTPEEELDAAVEDGEMTREEADRASYFRQYSEWRRDFRPAVKGDDVPTFDEWLVDDYGYAEAKKILGREPVDRAMWVDRALDAEAEALAPFDTPKVREARRYTLATPSTDTIDTPERRDLHDRIAAKEYGDGAKINGKEFTFWLGLPGSGKSTLAERDAEKNGALLTDADSIKKQLPEYAGGKGAAVVHVESTKIRDAVRDRAIANGDNVIVQTLGLYPDDLKKQIDALAAAGWAVHLKMADLPAEKAAERSNVRFEAGGHFVDPAHILSNGEVPRRTFDALKNHPGVTSYERYDTDVPKGEPARLAESGDRGARGGSSPSERAGADRGARVDRESGQGTRAEADKTGGPVGGQTRTLGSALPVEPREERPAPIRGVGRVGRVGGDGEQRPGSRAVGVHGDTGRVAGEASPGEAVEESLGTGGAAPTSGGGDRRDVRNRPDAGVGAAPGRGIHGREHGTLEPGAPAPEARIHGDEHLPAKDLAHRGTNYVLTDADDIGVGSPKTKVRQNLAAIALLREMRDGGRTWATPDEQSVLAKYVGWGAFPNYFKPGHPDYESPEGRVLRESLSDTEYERARSSTKNAHYTSPEIVRGMWDALRHLGFSHGQALEPSMGSGNFVGFAPEGMNIGWTGVEKDELTGQLAKYLYPESKIHVAGYEEVPLRNGAFDLAVSNVPFGQMTLYDPNYKHLRKFAIHDFFFAKSLDKVRAGGLVAFITSRYTMDKANDTVRAYIAERANLLGAVRLPHTAFKGNAGTDVVTDILFLQVRAKGEAPSGESWRELTRVPVPDRYGDTRDAAINEYYARHPEMMLGRLALHRGQFSDADLVLLPHDTGTIASAMATATKALPAGAYAPAAAPVRGAQQLPAVEAPPNTQPGTYVIHAGAVMQVAIDKTLTPATVSKAQEPKLRQLIALRDQARAVIRANTAADATDADIERERKVLEKQYRAFVKAFGPINLEKRTEGVNKKGTTWSRISYPNRSVIDDDPGLATLLSLEQYDASTDKAKPADLITKGRVIPKATAIQSVDTGFDAIAASLAARGKLDLAYMAELRGVTVESLKAELHGEIFENPATGEWEIKAKYLSGKVKDKLLIAERAAKENPQYEANVEALRPACPPDVPPASISVRFGAGWIKPSEYALFLAELLDSPGDAERIEVKQDEHSGKWALTLPSSLESSVANRSVHGTPRMTAADIIERSMNSLPLRITDTVKIGDNTKTYPNKEQTALVIAKQRELVARFRAWLFSDDAERGEQMLRRFNDDYNNTVPPKYEGALLTVPGIATHINGNKFEWFEHQKNAIMRFIQNGNILLAHAPGAGKTYTFVAMAMEARRLGFAKRPMIAVPNHMLAQATREAQQLYPGARILALGTDDTSSKAKTLLAARAASNEWDLIITTHMGMGRIPMSKTAQAEFLREELNTLRDVLEAEQRSGGLRRRNEPTRGKSRTVKQIEATIEDYEGRVKALMDAPSDDFLTFEELGVDLLIVDEAHEFKNLNFATRVEGIQVGHNKGATQLLMKTRYLHQINPTHGVVFATGTPVTNSVAELWTMQRYVNPKGLIESGHERFDDWQTIFGTLVSRMEKNTVGNYEVKSRLAKYVNVPSMIQRFREFADVKTINELGLPRPPLIGGTFAPITAPEPRGMAAYLAMLKEQWDALKKMKPEEARASGMSFLSLGNQAKMAGLDMRLVDASYDENDGPFKVNLAADEIHKLYEEHTPHKGVQVVFLDASVDKGEGAVSKLGGRPGFNLYAELKRLLVAHGIPAKEIAFSQDADTEAKKTALKRKMNDGELRVVIASTSQLGVGANIQKRLVALHRLDVPWRPDQIEQSEARILRMGNMLYDTGVIPGVRILRYVTQGSYDQYMWDTVLRKAKFVAQAMSGDASIAELDEMVDESAQGAQLMAALSSNNPLELERADLAQKVGELQAEAAGHRQQQAQLDLEIRTLQNQVARLAVEQKLAERDAVRKQDTSGDKFRITIGGTEYTKRVEAAPALKKAIASVNKGSKEVIGALAGFPLRAESGLRHTQIVIEAAMPHATMVGDEQSDAGVLASVEALTRKIGDPTPYPGWIAKAEQRMRELDQLVGREFPRAGDLADAEQRLRDVEAQLLAQSTTTEATEAASDAAEDYVDDGPADDEAGPGPKVRERPGGPAVGDFTDLYSFTDPITAALTMWKQANALRAARLSQTAGIRQIAPPKAPVLQRVAEMSRESREAIYAVLTPAAIDADAGQAGRVKIAKLGEKALSDERARTALLEAHAAMDKLPESQRYEFVDRYERGHPQPTPYLQSLDDAIHVVMQDRADAIKALGKGHLKTFRENYWGRMLVNAKSPVGQAFRDTMTRRPLAGAKSFMKKRSFEYLADALAAGYEPITKNPVDWLLLKVREMNRYIAAHEIKNELRAEGLVKFYRPSKRLPDGWAWLDDRIFVAYGGRDAEGAQRIRGKYAAPAPVARIVNNYLSPGLRGNPLYDSYMFLGNTMNMVQLGFSAFHLGFVAFDATISQGALGIEQLKTPGQRLAGAKNLGIASASMALAPATGVPVVSPALMYAKGRALRRAYLHGTTDLKMERLVEAVAQGGGRVRMDDLYRTDAYQKMKQAFRDRRWLGTVLEAPFAAIEQSMKPILEHIVPRLKLGAFYAMAERELAQLPTGATEDDIRRVLQAVWTTIDDRLGQVVYDNYHWHNVTKHMLMGGVRAVGWNRGSISLTVGGAATALGAPVRAWRLHGPGGAGGGGKGGGGNRGVVGGASAAQPGGAFNTHGDQVIDHKLAYVIAAGALMALYGAIYTYLHSGDRPGYRNGKFQGAAFLAKDLYVPRTGTVNRDHSLERITPATYIKDVISFGHHPVDTFLHKMQPALSLLASLIENKDYFGDDIRNTDDPVLKQAQQDATAVLHAYLPIAASNFLEARKRNTSTRERIENFIGNAPASREMVRTPAQNLMQHYLGSRVGGLTPEARDAANERSDLRRALQDGDATKADVRKLVIAGELTPRQGANVASSTRRDPRVLQYEKLTPDQALKVFDVANDEERALYERIYEARKRQVERRARRQAIGHGMSPPSP